MSTDSHRGSSSLRTIRTVWMGVSLNDWRSTATWSDVASSKTLSTPIAMTRARWGGPDERGLIEANRAIGPLVPAAMELPVGRFADPERVAARHTECVNGTISRDQLVDDGQNVVGAGGEPAVR